MNCPGCGANVAFRSERAPYSVCSSCGQMLIRREFNLDLLGQVAECQPDGTLLQVGTRGQNLTRGFTVAGRVQLRYGDGFWNEWFLLYDDGSEGWLGEAMGQYFLSSRVGASKVPTKLSSPPELGQLLTLDDQSYAVLDIKTVEVASFEGELPSLATVGVPYVSVDLRGSEGNGLTIDYQEQPPTAYQGRWTDFRNLVFQNLRDDVSPEFSVDSSQIRSVSCHGCGAPFELVIGPASRTYVCQYCGCAMDSSRPEVVSLGEVVDRAQTLAASATLKLGMEVHLSEGAFRLIGFCESSTRIDGQSYFWKEYLLYHRCHGYRWLSQTEYHFTLFRQLHGVPQAYGGAPKAQLNTSSLRYQGDRYRHFQTSLVTTERVVGEFYWRLSQGERSQSWDFISPPYMLSASVTETDITWSQGRYVSHEELGRMIPDLEKLKTSWSPGANQPNPHQPKKYLPVFVGAAVLAYGLVSSGALLAKEQVVWQQDRVPFRASGLVAEAALKSVSGSLRLDVEIPDLKERFVELKATLTPTQSGATGVGSLRLGNPRKEGTVRGATFLTQLPNSPGQFRIEALTGPPVGPIPLLRETPNQTLPSTQQERFHLNFKLTQLAPGPGYGSLFFALLLIASAPLAAAAMANDFEKRRWAESDYG